ncbi:hypothetical protein BCV72DRAFT_305678 [Rhizopus microsporus var. microsporus]|uniref:Uncharacterized protein n=1 Tax=Rhizopus microsporus var. microsporus TaxID=86635 RepID=A0A1X0R2Y4_RHIZD|nr:hypothetical protein BCV72DRAFT_305678 [Rhizopus microsporus var. microsporus]
MYDSGINTNKFKAHSLRSTASTKADQHKCGSDIVNTVFEEVTKNITTSEVRVEATAIVTLLLHEHDWNEPRLSFQGKTIARSKENGKVMYNVLLDEANGHILKLSEGAIKHVGPLSAPVVQEIVVNTNVVEAEDLLENAVDEDEEEESIDLTSSPGWTASEVYMNFRLSSSAEGFTSLSSRLMMNNGRCTFPLDYFLFFLPVDHVYSIIHNTSLHARSFGHWEDITLHEYLMWIALLTVMTVVRHEGFSSIKEKSVVQHQPITVKGSKNIVNQYNAGFAGHKRPYPFDNKEGVDEEQEEAEAGKEESDEERVKMAALTVQHLSIQLDVAHTKYIDGVIDSTTAQQFTTAIAAASNDSAVHEYTLVKAVFEVYDKVYCGKIPLPAYAAKYNYYIVHHLLEQVANHIQNTARGFFPGETPPTAMRKTA